MGVELQCVPELPRIAPPNCPELPGATIRSSDKGPRCYTGYGCTAYRCNTLGRCSSIDPILQVMLASNYGVFASSLLSLRSTFPWVSRAIFRYS
jgi:hypothetical protein